MLKAYDAIGDKVDRPEVAGMIIEEKLGATQASNKDISNLQHTADNSVMTRDSLHGSLMRPPNMVIQNQQYADQGGDAYVNNFIHNFNE